jgi:hypothetical protein
VPLSLLPTFPDPALVQPVAQLLDSLVIGIQDAFEGRTASIAVEQPIALLFLRR